MTKHKSFVDCIEEYSTILRDNKALKSRLNETEHQLSLLRKERDRAEKFRQEISQPIKNISSIHMSASFMENGSLEDWSDLLYKPPSTQNSFPTPIVRQLSKKLSRHSFARDNEATKSTGFKLFSKPSSTTIPSSIALPSDQYQHHRDTSPSSSNESPSNTANRSPQGLKSSPQGEETEHVNWNHYLNLSHLFTKATGGRFLPQGKNPRRQIVRKKVLALCKKYHLEIKYKKFGRNMQEQFPVKPKLLQSIKEFEDKAYYSDDNVKQYGKSEGYTVQNDEFWNN